MTNLSTSDDEGERVDTIANDGCWRLASQGPADCGADRFRLQVDDAASAGLISCNTKLHRAYQSRELHFHRESRLSGEPLEDYQV